MLGFRVKGKRKTEKLPEKGDGGEKGLGLRTEPQLGDLTIVYTRKSMRRCTQSRNQGALRDWY